MKKIPSVRKKLEDETAKVRVGFEKEMLGPTSELADILKIPEQGLGQDEIIDLTKQYLGCGHFDWKQGTQSGTVYNGILLILIARQSSIYEFA